MPVGVPRLKTTIPPASDWLAGICVGKPSPVLEGPDDGFGVEVQAMDTNRASITSDNRARFIVTS